MSDQTNNYGYTDPVAKLLTLGDKDILSAASDQWPNYPSKYGLTQEHIPALIDMALNTTLHEMDTESKAVWGPVYAWRTLGQLRAVEAAEPLTRLFSIAFDEQDDGMNDLLVSDLSRVYSMIGPSALSVLGQYLQNTNYTPEARESAAHAITQIAHDHPEASDEAYALLIYELMHAERNEPFLNGMIIGNLLEEKVDAALPAIEHAFKVGRVDTTIVGDWEEVQEEMGLITLTDEQKEAKAKAREEIFMNQMFGGNPEMMNAVLNRSSALPISDSGSASSWRKADKAAAKAKKNKRKQAAKSRKVNRKKK